jgi:hypothetical protein
MLGCNLARGTHHHGGHGQGCNCYHCGETEHGADPAQAEKQVQGREKLAAAELDILSQVGLHWCGHHQLRRPAYEKCYNTRVYGPKDKKQF